MVRLHHGVEVDFLSPARATEVDGDKKLTATFCQLRLRRQCGHVNKTLDSQPWEQNWNIRTKTEIAL